MNLNVRHVVFVYHYILCQIVVTVGSITIITSSDKSQIRFVFKIMCYRFSNVKDTTDNLRAFGLENKAVAVAHFNSL